MDKRTDINTASFAYSVSLLRIRISGYPPGAGTKRQSIHTAVLHGILSLNYGNVTMNGIAVAWRRKILNRLVLSTVMEN